MARLTKLDRSVRGRVVIVTGAGSGMGRETARVFADEGARVAVTDVNLEPVQAVVDEILAAGGDARAWKLDVGSDEEVARVVEEIGAHFGGIDCLVNNAGIASNTPIDHADYPAVWDRHVNVLLTAHVRTIRAALPYLRRSDAARIVNIASTEALGATPGQSAYSAAKAGVAGLTRSLAVELGPEGITCNCICPGPIRTGMTQAIPDEHKVIFARRRTALKRYGDPEEVAQMTVSLCLPAASYLTGTVIPVDGGLMARNA